jgi:CheY-like chemotaxis protein
MPVMDGMTMLKLLKQDQSTKSTKVIMLTNLEPSDKIIGNLVKDQPTYYFVKSDIRLDDLTEKIKELLAE